MGWPVATIPGLALLIVGCVVTVVWLVFEALRALRKKPTERSHSHRRRTTAKPPSVEQTEINGTQLPPQPYIHPNGGQR